MKFADQSGCPFPDMFVLFPNKRVASEHCTIIILVIHVSLVGCIIWKKGIPNLPICFYVDLVITQLMSIVAQYAHRIQHDAHEPHSGPSCPPQILDLYNSRKGSSLVYLWAGVGHGMWQTRASSIMFKVGNINSISSLKLHMRKLKHSGFKLKSTIHPFPQCRLLCLRCHF